MGRCFLPHSHWALKLWGGEIPRKLFPTLPVSTPGCLGHRRTSRAGKHNLGFCNLDLMKSVSSGGQKPAWGQFCGCRPSHGSALRLRECIAGAAWLDSSFWLFVQQ